ncbi:MAG: hypothetical protein ACRD8O_05310 [Bryobacteraceae bacterium]
MGLYRWVLSGIVGSAAALLSCSGGPAPPTPGTLPFYWAAAQETFKTGDYIKTGDHLDQLTRSENEFTARAAPWRLILLAGLGRGYMDIAERFDQGVRANKTNPGPLRKRLLEYRSMASRYQLQFAEAFEKFQKTQTQGDVTLALPFPRGSPAPVAALNRVAEGAVLPTPELESAQTQALQRAVLLEVCRAAGAKDDAARASEILKTPPVQLPRPTFLFAMAESFSEGATLFGPRKLAQPDRLEYFNNRALDVLKGLPDSPQVKALKEKVQEESKKSKSGRS